MSVSASAGAAAGSGSGVGVAVLPQPAKVSTIMHVIAARITHGRSQIFRHAAEGGSCSNAAMYGTTTM